MTSIFECPHCHIRVEIEAGFGEPLPPIRHMNCPSDRMVVVD